MVDHLGTVSRSLLSMPETTLINIFAMAVCAGIFAVFSLWLITKLVNLRLDTRNKRRQNSVSFLFHRDILTDLDRKIEASPGSGINEIINWNDLREWLGTRFGPLPLTLSEIKSGETLNLEGVNKHDQAVLTLSSLRGAERVRLFDPQVLSAIGKHRARCIDTSLSQFVSVLEKAPCAIHVFDPFGKTIWKNAEFSRFTKEEKEALLEVSKKLSDDTRIRMPGEHKGQDRYFDIQQKNRGEAKVLYVTDVTQIAQAETARRDFIQTLTKTFADLATGLAVFDHHRRLVLFNPALLRLTRLPAPFLSSQPPLPQFFDKLRDNKVLPEPKNYGTWRQQVDDMINTACDGLYAEDWSLPNGITYRVTGRPHPNGAVAFLFEDISDEISLTRRFRSQIDLRQAALDRCHQAIAIIGPSNVVVLCNKPCSRLLGIDPDATFAEMSTQDFLAICEEKLPNDRFWNDVESAIVNRTSALSILDDKKGRQHQCSVSALPGNSSMIAMSDVGQVAEREEPRISVFS